MVGVGFPQLYNNLLTKAFNDYDYVLLQWINTQKRQVYSRLMSTYFFRPNA